jgi:hypothetical protein
MQAAQAMWICILAIIAGLLAISIYGRVEEVRVRLAEIPKRCSCSVQPETVDTSQVGHPSIEQVLNVTDFGSNGHAVRHTLMVLI